MAEDERRVRAEAIEDVMDLMDQYRNVPRALWDEVQALLEACEADG